MQSQGYIGLNKGDVKAESIIIKEEFHTEAENEIKKESLKSLTIKQEFTSETANDVNNYTIYEIQELQNFENTDVKVEVSKPQNSFENIQCEGCIGPEAEVESEMLKIKKESLENTTIKQECANENNVNNYTIYEIQELQKFKSCDGEVEENCLLDLCNLDKNELRTPGTNHHTSLDVMAKAYSADLEVKTHDITETPYNNVASDLNTRFPYEKYYQARLNCFVCLKCTNTKQFKTKEYIIRHIRIAHFGLKYICPECKKNYSDRSGLKKHLKKEHNLNIPRLKSNGLLVRAADIQDQEDAVATKIGNWRKTNAAAEWDRLHKERSTAALQCEPKVINEAEIETSTTENIDLKKLEDVVTMESDGCGKSLISAEYQKPLQNLFSIDGVKSGNILENSNCGGAHTEIKIEIQDESSYDSAYVEKTTDALQRETKVMLEMESNNLISEDMLDSTHHHVQKCEPNREEPYNIEHFFLNKKSVSYKQYYKVQGYYIICLKCTNPKKFKFKSDVTRHIRHKHFGVKFKCPECKRIFLGRYQLKKHLKEGHNLNINTFKDHHLIKFASAESNCEDNVNFTAGAVQNNAGNGETDCNTESIATATSIRSYEQYFEVKGNTIFCLKCTKSKEFKARDAIIRHIRIKHLGRKHICPECKNVYVDKQGLKKHIDLNHKVNIDRLKSDCLTKNATDLDLLEATEPKTDQATAIIEEPADNPCNAGQIVLTKANKISLVQYYKKQGINFICLKCVNSMEFKYRGTVTAHLLSKHFGIRYFCPECGKEFLQKRNLKDHLKTNHELNIDELKTESYLKYSENTEDVKTSLDNNDNYKQYYKILGNHVICLKCINSKEYSNRSSVIRHISSEHLGRRFSCPECKKEYVDKRPLLNHLKNCHMFNNNQIMEMRFLKSTTGHLVVDQGNTYNKETTFGAESVCNDGEDSF